jgi:hypothetical protein
MLFRSFMCMPIERIMDGSNADIGANSYHMYKVSTHMPPFIFP